MNGAPMTYDLSDQLVSTNTPGAAVALIDTQALARASQMDASGLA